MRPPTRPPQGSTYDERRVDPADLGGGGGGGLHIARFYERSFVMLVYLCHVYLASLCLMPVAPPGAWRTCRRYGLRAAGVCALCFQPPPALSLMCLQYLLAYSLRDYSRAAAQTTDVGDWSLQIAEASRRPALQEFRMLTLTPICADRGAGTS